MGGSPFLGSFASVAKGLEPHSGVVRVGFELLGCCSMWCFCGESLFPSNHSGLEDADSETPGQLTSALSQSSSALGPAAHPARGLWLWFVFRWRWR